MSCDQISVWLHHVEGVMQTHVSNFSMSSIGFNATQWSAEARYQPCGILTLPYLQKHVRVLRKLRYSIPTLKEHGLLRRRLQDTAPEKARSHRGERLTHQTKQAVL